MFAFRSPLSRMAFGGLVALVVVIGGTGASVWMRSGPGPVSCPDRPIARPSGYQPIPVGPVTLDPGPEAGVGTELKWYSQSPSLGFVTKLFVHITIPEGGTLQVSASNVTSGKPLLFDYPQGHVEDSPGYRPVVVYDSKDLQGFGKISGIFRGAAGIPGAVAAPELGS